MLLRLKLVLTLIDLWLEFSLSQKEHLGKHEETIINVNRKRGGTRRGVDVESRESSLQNKREATEDWCLFVVLFEKNHKHK